MKYIAKWLKVPEHELIFNEKCYYAVYPDEIVRTDNWVFHNKKQTCVVIKEVDDIFHLYDIKDKTKKDIKNLL